MANIKPSPRATTGFTRKPGRREMKEYPVTSRELWTLGGLQLGAGASFSVAGWLLGVYVSSEQALSFAGKDTAAKVLGQWEGYAHMSWYGCIALACLGVALFAISALNVRGIIKETSHVP